MKHFLKFNRLMLCSESFFKCNPFMINKLMQHYIILFQKRSVTTSTNTGIMYFTRFRYLTYKLSILTFSFFFS